MIVALTGHRSEDAESESIVRRKVRNALDPDRITVVINGLANGLDLWGADEALELGIEVWSARPWAGHRPRAGDEALYERVIRDSSKVVNVVEQDSYPGAWVYHKRNEWMVDHATHLLAYWSGKESGGTYACWNYAEGKIKRKNIYNAPPY